MTRIAAGWLQPHTCGENFPDRQQSQAIKADQRRLLSELIDGGIADGKDRNPIGCRVEGVSRSGLRTARQLRDPAKRLWER